MTDKRGTTYSIIDEHGAKSSITVDKFVGDALQKYLPDVHAWIQQIYTRVAKNNPELGRIEKGNKVRTRALIEAGEQLRKHGALDDF